MRDAREERPPAAEAPFRDERSAEGCGCVIPGLALVAISFAWAAIGGAQDVWGDGLPWVTLCWAGLVLAGVGAVVAVATHRPPPAGPGGSGVAPEGVPFTWGGPATDGGRGPHGLTALATESDMGTEMMAYIEYDSTPDWWRKPGDGGLAEMSPPFADAFGEPDSLTRAGGINTGSKDYRFFAALAGVRNETGVPPLFPPRGLPPNPCSAVLGDLDSHGELGDFGTSWLRPSEVEAALDHHRVDRTSLHFETQTILAVLANLAGRLGDDRVRLVFGFW